MHLRTIATFAILALVLSLAATGCAPKKPASQTTETSTTGQPAAGPAGQGAQTEQQPGAAPAGTAASQTQAAGGFDQKVYFDYDSVDLSPDSIKVLNDLADFLKANTELKLQVAGNCDERGTTEYNLALGDRRAKAAKDYLTTKGIDGLRIGTVSYGEEKPVDPSNTEEAWAKNRRDDFLFSK
jgi:peptidoglycan-associated lipoprotein